MLISLEPAILKYNYCYNEKEYNFRTLKQLLTLKHLKSIKKLRHLITE